MNPSLQPRDAVGQQRPASKPRIIREPECRDLTGLSRSQRWRLEGESRFPRRVPISERASGWIESEVLAWIEARANARAKAA